MGWVLWAAGKVGWYFYAWGPQMLICLYFGYLSARKTQGDTLNWLVASFCASLIPIGGVVVMLAVWWRAGTPPPPHATTDPGVAAAPSSPQTAPSTEKLPASGSPEGSV